MYTSIPYTPIELRQPTCTKYAAGLAAMLTKTSHVVAGNPLIVLTDHAVIAYVMSSAFTLTPLKQRRIQKILTAPNIQYVTEGVNAADLMLEGDPANSKVEGGFANHPFGWGVANVHGWLLLV